MGLGLAAAALSLQGDAFSTQEMTRAGLQADLFRTRPWAH